MNSDKNYSRLMGLLIVMFAIASSAKAQNKQAMMKKLKNMAPAKGYVLAHKDAPPQPLLGGPVEVTVTQKSGGIFAIIPSPREGLDPYVFGTPSMPRAFGGTPGVNGLPPMARKTNGGHYTATKNPTPFGNKRVVLPNGKLTIKATDATATDAKSTNDKVKFDASWQDKEGNTYEVKCCQKLAAHGMEYPTFGGVVTNHILHGFSRIGTALMPSEFTYFAFWGMGAVLKNGKVIDKPRLIHGMLTEYVRTEGYKLATDEEVTPGRRQFHLMIPPYMPDPKNLSFKKDPLKSGFMLPNGKELPFWHVMFENLQINGNR
ncbi:MAG TPA: hypothetical protein VJ964_05740 [Balneolaceae bacterium]|nr:hypothetical protein [Balneolaceae bacterium]